MALHGYGMFKVAEDEAEKIKESYSISWPRFHYPVANIGNLKRRIHER